MYPVVLKVTNTSGKFAEARFDIYVLAAEQRPTARFVTTDVVGFVGLPLGFDAIYSSDPQNAILGYTWNFGDGSPLGFGPQISRVYTAPGVYTVTLTIRDRDNLISIASRQIVVLPADQIGKFNSDITYKVKWDRGKENVDSFSLDATVNVGPDLQVAAGD